MQPKNVAYDICRYYIKDQEGIDAELLRRVDGYRRSRNLDSLSSCTTLFDSAFHSINEWRFLRQVEAFFKKNSIYADKDVCEASARETFFRCEELCAKTNIRLDFCYSKRDQLDPDLRSQLSRMQRYISNVLGEFSRFEAQIPELVKVTPGATSSTTRRESLPQLKLKMKIFAPKSAASYIRALYRYFGFKSPKIVFTDTNRVERVPKNWKTDRTIACEPEGALPFQLAFDTYGKRRLSKFGINLRNQFANQELARLASLCDDFVTVDGENASSTISFNTVAWLFPGDWFRYLCRFRSKRFTGCFGDGKYQMFSSMGNGATFVIETLIFAAACYAVGSKDFLVYGDDVIIEKEFYSEYCKLTAFLGLKINHSKTFAEGPFRESCGLDSWLGIDVTPVYIRGVDKRKASLSHLVNTMCGIASPGGALANYLHELVLDNKLAIVPFNESTTSGVWIDPDLALQLGFLRKRFYRRKDGTLVNSGLLRFKAYQPENINRPFVDSRGYYLWFLRKNAQALFSGPWTLHRVVDLQGEEEGFESLFSVSRDSDPHLASQTSSVPIYQHRYVRRWVGWFPANTLPLHLDWWSTYDFPLESRKRKQRG
jgi:hypothetical protein